MPNFATITRGLLPDGTDVITATADVSLRAPSVRPHTDSGASEARKSLKPVTKDDNDHQPGAGEGGGGGRHDDDERSPWEWMVDQAEQAGEWIKGAAEDAGEWIEDAAEEVAETAGAVADAALDLVNAGIGLLGDGINALVEQGFEGTEAMYDFMMAAGLDDALDKMEETGGFEPILDLVETYEEGGTLHFEVGGENTGLEMDISKEEFLLEASIFGNGGHLGAGSDGSFSLGLDVDLGPLGEASVDLDVEEDGDVSIGADGEVHLPYPGGSFDLEGGGSWTQDDGAYTVAADVTVGHTTATGQHTGVGAHGSVTDDGEGGHTTELGTHEVLGQRGVGEIRVEETITIHSDDGEITGTEGEIVVETEGPKGRDRWETDVWDTEDDAGGGRTGGRGGKRNNGNGNGNGDSGKGDPPPDGPDDDLDDIVIGRRPAAVPAASMPSASLPELDDEVIVGVSAPEEPVVPTEPVEAIAALVAVPVFEVVGAPEIAEMEIVEFDSDDETAPVPDDVDELP